MTKNPEIFEMQCPYCIGSGLLDYAYRMTKQPCPQCGGSGKLKFVKFDDYLEAKKR